MGIFGLHILNSYAISNGMPCDMNAMINRQKLIHLGLAISFEKINHQRYVTGLSLAKPDI